MRSLFLQVIGCHCFQIAKQTTAQTDKLLHLMNVIHHFYCNPGGYVIASLCPFVRLCLRVKCTFAFPFYKVTADWGDLSKAALPQLLDHFIRWQKMNWKQSLRVEKTCKLFITTKCKSFSISVCLNMKIFIFSLSNIIENWIPFGFDKINNLKMLLWALGKCDRLTINWK